ncbi:MAG: hypothetical protein EOM23_04935, partial [Candidatus Moranbacteria bacterium]|nr:hypothetical protein [Candidatus Moranbacteria bacterium]
MILKSSETATSYRRKTKISNFGQFIICKIQISCTFAKNFIMIKSMTGYGKATAEIRGNMYTAEIKTLNS